MTNIGIDLGTTNSAIATFDGSQVTIHKSPQQMDVTPSAISFNSRGGRSVGTMAYIQAAHDPRRAATLFKRLMGTSSPIDLPDAGVVMSPEEASSIILGTLFGYLPEEMRNSPDGGTVITVPAAFNQMQKEATLEAARLADIGRVVLMQEPVAAVMSVMAASPQDGVFLVFDLGGGTLDVAIAESHAGRVNLLEHGGVAMLGGRDIDRFLFDSITKPWLYETFNLPPDFMTNHRYEKLRRIATWAGEQAKIELSSRESAQISRAEDELRTADEAGTDLYLDLTITRSQLDRLIEPLVADAVRAARDAIRDASLSNVDIGRIVFVGGPTTYKPLRDKVAFELGIPAGELVNPMTAVATGAAIFAESVDWTTDTRQHKRARADVDLGSAISFRFNARTPDTSTKVAIGSTNESLPPLSFEFTSMATGWNSGRIPFKPGMTVELPLGERGTHVFRVEAFDASGHAFALDTDRIVVDRIAATIDGIPASHTISVEAKTKVGGAVTLVPLVRKGDQLPKKGRVAFRSEIAVPAGSAKAALHFKVWEGEFETPEAPNQQIGAFTVTGEDVLDGVIPVGAELIFDYEMADSGNFDVTVTVPAIGASVANKESIYTRQYSQIDYADAAGEIESAIHDATRVLDRLESTVADDRLDMARQKLEAAEEIDLTSVDAEQAKYADDTVREAHAILAQVQRENRSAIRRAELDEVVEDFNTNIREYASVTEAAAFDNLTRTTARAIETGSPDAETHMGELHSQIFGILWQQPWFVREMFEDYAQEPWRYDDRDEFQRNVGEGRMAIERGDIPRLRGVVATLHRTMRTSKRVRDVDTGAMANIILGA